MKHWIFKLALFLVLGTVLNAAIALGFWWKGERPPVQGIDYLGGDVDFVIIEIGSQDKDIWLDRRESDWPLEPQAVSMHNYLGISHRRLTWILLESSRSPDGLKYRQTTVDSYTISIVQLGWPMRCIAREDWYEWHGPNTPHQTTYGMFTAFGTQWPNRVLWSGTSINVLLCCSVIALTHLSALYIRRAIRRKRGHCIKCGYDLRGTSGGGCPECGWGREAEA